ncbi:transposable element Tcb2 transposase [Trichonephila clavipes]|nr:transposable element Tcb2 transposase [Trichonephila clavipes]
MACYRQTGIGANTTVSRTLLESPEVLLQGCGIDYKKQEMLDVDQGRTEKCYAAAKTVALATGRRVSSQTVRNRLHEGGIYARRPMVCIPLTPRPRAARRRWAAEHRLEQHDWSQVLFTDESLFSLECDTRCVLVWRGQGALK